MKPKILSGAEIVAKGVTKLGVTLPEIGLKDIIPNGSWLEQKQIQAALEARKHLVEVERIEKRGTLSHAEWHHETKLAEVTQKVGGYWQYFGHNVGKKIYLYPEEVLFLMEINCLLLKQNEIPLSLQEAYSLLLYDQKSILQYTVYASLSRQGYKVFRYKASKDCKIMPLSPNTAEKVGNDTTEIILDTTDTTTLLNSVDSTEKESSVTEVSKVPLSQNTQEKIVNDFETLSNTVDSTEKETSMDIDVNKNMSDHFEIENKSANASEHNDADTVMEIVTDPEHSSETVNQQNDKILEESSDFVNLISAQTKCKSKLKCKYRIGNRKAIRKSFENFPDLYQKTTAILNAPDKSYLPENILLDKCSFAINLVNIKTKASQPPSRTYSVSDEANASNVLRIRSSNETESPQNNWNPFQSNFPRPNFQFRNFISQPRHNLNYYQYPTFFQRGFVPNFLNYNPRFQFIVRNRLLFQRFPLYHHHNVNTATHSNINVHSRRRSIDNVKHLHLESVKNLALRLKLLGQNIQLHHQQALQKLIETYNNKYSTKLQLTADFEIIVNETILDTIELEDDENPPAKKPRLDNTEYDKHFNKLKQTAIILKNLEAENKVTTRHKRALSNAVKAFNNSYNADIYVNNNYDVIDKRHINLDSSDSDVVIEECPQKKSKKLRNPFNILKRLSENNIAEGTKSTNNEIESPGDFKYDEAFFNVFGKNWLPNKDDFGRAEIVSQRTKNGYTIGAYNEKFLYDFIKSHSFNYESWEEIKQALWDNLEETSAMLENESIMANKLELNSIVKPEDCTDLPSILKKLSIIKPNKDNGKETNLNIDFDVYNRDVQNFRKRCPPKPHFRIICIEVSASPPTALDISTLNSKFNDNINILFAIVDRGSVSYLQLNPIELPMYLPANNSLL